MMSSTVVVVGSVNVDLRINVDRLPNQGETVFGNGGSLHSGGKGANQAVAAARLGVGVIFIGAIGRDSNGVFARESLSSAKVDVSLIQEVESPTGTAIVLVNGRGENSIVVIPAANSDIRLSKQEIDCIRNAPIVLSQGEIDGELIGEIAKLAQGRFILNLAPFFELPLSVLRLANPLILNQHEAELLSVQLKIPNSTSNSPKILAQALINLGIPSLVITLGAKGALVANGGTIELVEAPATRVVDTTGAGDAFCGAFVSELIRGQSSKEATIFAVRAASYSTQLEGTQTSYASLADLQQET